MARALSTPDSVGVSIVAGAAATVLSRAAGLARGIALAWLMPASQFGLLGLAMLVVNAMLPAVSAGLYEGAVRYAPLHEAAGTLRRFALQAFGWGGAVALGLCLALLPFSGPVGRFLFSAAGQTATPGSTDTATLASVAAIYRAMLACLLILTAYHISLGFFKGLRIFRALGAIEVTHAAVFTVAAVGAVYFMDRTATNVLLAYALSVLLCTLGALIVLRRRVAETEAPARIRHGRAPARTLLLYSGWSAVTAVSMQFALLYPVWFVLRRADAETAGAYQGLRMFLQFVQIGASLLAGIVAANATRTWESQGASPAQRQLRFLSRRVLVVLLMGSVVMSLMQTPIMFTLPSSFRLARAVYDPTIVYFLLIGLAALLGVRLQLAEKPAAVTLAWLLGCAVSMIAAPMLFKYLGAGRSNSHAALLAATWAGILGGMATILVIEMSVIRKGLDWDACAAVLVAVGVLCAFGWPLGGPVVIVTTVILRRRKALTLEPSDSAAPRSGRQN